MSCCFFFWGCVFGNVEVRDDADDADEDAGSPGVDDRDELVAPDEDR